MWSCIALQCHLVRSSDIHSYETRGRDNLQTYQHRTSVSLGCAVDYSTLKTKIYRYMDVNVYYSSIVITNLKSTIRCGSLLELLITVLYEFVRVV